MANYFTGRFWLFLRGVAVLRWLQISWWSQTANFDSEQFWYLFQILRSQGSGCVMARKGMGKSWRHPSRRISGWLKDSPSWPELPLLFQTQEGLPISQLHYSKDVWGSHSNHLFHRHFWEGLATFLPTSRSYLVAFSTPLIPPHGFLSEICRPKSTSSSFPPFDGYFAGPIPIFRPSSFHNSLIKIVQHPYFWWLPSGRLPYLWKLTIFL